MLKKTSEGLYFKGELRFIQENNGRGIVSTPNGKIIVIADEDNIYYYCGEKLVWCHNLNFKCWPLKRMSVSEDGQFVAVYSAYDNEINLDVFQADGKVVESFRCFMEFGAPMRNFKTIQPKDPMVFWEYPGGFNTKKIVESFAEITKKEYLKRVIELLVKIGDGKSKKAAKTKKKADSRPSRSFCKGCVLPCSKTGDWKCCLDCGTLENIWSKPAERIYFDCNWCQAALAHY